MREKYESLPLAELKAVAKARGIKGISTMKKDEVVEAMLQEDEREKREKEAKEKAEEEARKREEEAKKMTKSEALLTEIVELLKNK